MIKRTLAVLVVVSFAMTTLPVLSAAESVSEEYFGTAGARALGNDNGRAVSWRPCPGGCDLDDDLVNPGPEVPDVVRMGGGPLFASQSYSNVIVSVSDDVFGSQGAVAACFWNPEGVTFNICDDEDYRSDISCGSIPLLGSPFPSDRITVWVHTVLVTADLDTCGGWSGTMTGDFF